MNQTPKLEHISPADLIPHARNAKLHNRAQLEQIADSIKQFGFLAPVLIDQDNGIIAGHARTMAALKIGLEKIPAIRLNHLTEIQRRAYILADNKLAETGGGWNEDLLKLELAAINESDLDALITGFTEEELTELLTEDKELNGDPDEVPEAPEEPTTKLGDLWLLGDHRLLCGDSTKAEDVERLMAGAKAGAVVTDPPYGIGIDGQKESICKNPKHNRKAHKFMGWDSERPSAELFQSVVGMSCPAAIFGGNYFADLLPASRGWIYWSKGQDGLSMSDGELAWTNTSKPLRCVTVNRAALHGSVHPTQKPVEVIAFAVKYIEPHDGPIYDPFLGSGTTLIAAEQLGRKCYGMEISPAYCDVIVKRWETLTGKKATRSADVL